MHTPSLYHFAFGHGEEQHTYVSNDHQRKSLIHTSLRAEFQELRPFTHGPALGNSDLMSDLHYIQVRYVAYIYVCYIMHIQVTLTIDCYGYM